MNWLVKPFDELTTQELHNILRLRGDVFVVEQDCVYADIDGLDPKASHLFTYNSEEQIVACCRIFFVDEVSQIGRVVIAKESRKAGLGKEIMEKAIQHISQNKKIKQIQIEAQSYLEDFYKSLGFVPEGKEYKMDGIGHLKMTLNL